MLPLESAATQANIVAQALLRPARRGHDGRLLAAPVEADERRRVHLRSAILAAEGDDIAGANGEMTDRELMQRRREAMLFEEVAGLGVNINKRGLHVGKVKFALTVGMGADAAVAMTMVRPWDNSATS
jgi:hypothetical protein